jgi:ATP synthase F1 complex assembly factor 2
MKHATQSALRALRSRQFLSTSPPLRRHIQSTPTPTASVAPLTAAGPPPAAPVPAAESLDARIARKKKQAELLKRGQDMRGIAAGKGGGSAGSKRFWKDVIVSETPDGTGYQIMLDKRPLRTPSKQVLRVPKSKPMLAAAIALEWDLLVSAQQALRSHLIPLTSLVSRALDIEMEDREGKTGEQSARAQITKSVLRYLDTDSLLCWAPEPKPDPPGYETHVDRTESLLAIQKRAAGPIVGWLSERVWPGVEIVPVLEGESVMPRPQPRTTLDVISGWIAGLPAWELAGLERAVLAGKGLCVAARLVGEWSEELGHLREGSESERKFGVEEAAHAATLEIEYQLGMWGVVEDTHDVDREDVKRQFGSVVLLVSGDKAP